MLGSVTLAETCDFNEQKKSKRKHEDLSVCRESITDYDTSYGEKRLSSPVVSATIAEGKASANRGNSLRRAQTQDSKKVLAATKPTEQVYCIPVIFIK